MNIITYFNTILEGNFNKYLKKYFEEHQYYSKTKKSIRTLPINKILLDDLKLLKNEDSKIHGFNDNYFLAGNAFPISSNAFADRKNRNCDLASVPQIRIHDFRHSYAFSSY